MQTPTHLLVSALVGRQLARHGIAVHFPAMLLGSVLPDLPFFLLTVGGEVYYRWLAPLPVEGSVMEHLHLTLFFTDPFWIASHNLFHSLIVNGILIGVGYLGWRRQRRWGLALFWLAASMLFHTLLDIAVHHSDGPLFLFPLSWTYRFASPISYWEPERYGRFVTAFELGLNGLLLAYFARLWWRRGWGALWVGAAAKGDQCR